MENVSDGPEGADNNGLVAGKKIADVGSIVTQDSLSVNTQNSEVKKSSRGMMGAFAEDKAALEKKLGELYSLSGLPSLKI